MMCARARHGQSMFEAIISLAIFGIAALTLVASAAGSSSGVFSASYEVEATALADEAMEALHNIRDGAWNEFQYSSSQIATSSGQWVLNGVVSPQTIGDFTRAISFEDICRDSSGAIAVCPAMYTDPHTKYATVAVSWSPRFGITRSITRSAYLTNWDSRDWIQTDWSGGAGQSVWSNAVRFDSSSNIDFATAGSFLLQRASPSWQADPASGIVTTQQINHISIVNSGDIRAAANSQQFLNYGGVAWNIFQDAGSQNVNGIDMVTATDGWAAGASGKIWHRNASTWTEAWDTGGQTWQSVSMLSSGSDGWIVGSGGNIRRYAGGNWSNVSSPVSQALNGVYAVSAADAWAVGNSGKIIRWNGSSWSEVLDTGNQTLNAVFMLDSNNGWLVGSGGTIYRRVGGGAWVSVSSPVNNNLNDVYAINANDAWAVGNSGVIIHWNGSSWAQVSSPTTRTLTSIAMVNASEGWAAGANGTILHYVGSYASPGTLTSSAFSLSDNSPVQEIEWDGVVPTGCSPACSIVFQIQTAPDAGGVPGAWSAWSSNFTISAGERIPVSFNGARWVRYRATLSGDPSHTPTVNEIRINYK